MRRTKAVLIHRKTGNPRAVQLLLEHTKLESTVPTPERAAVSPPTHENDQHGNDTEITSVISSK
jgi:hypothetical protein